MGWNELDQLRLVGRQVRRDSSRGMLDHALAARSIHRRSSSSFLRASLATLPYDGTRASILAAPSQGIPTLQVLCAERATFCHD